MKTGGRRCVSRIGVRLGIAGAVGVAVFDDDDYDFGNGDKGVCEADAFGDAVYAHGAPFPDAYGSLIERVKDTTDDASLLEVSDAWN